MDVAAALYPCLTCALLLIAMVSVGRRFRNPELHYDVQVSVFLAGRFTRFAYVAALVLAAALHVLLGVAFLGAGYPFAWGLFPLAVLPLMLLGYLIYVASLPLDYPHQESNLLDSESDPPTA